MSKELKGRLIAMSHQIETIKDIEIFKLTKEKSKS